MRVQRGTQQVALNAAHMTSIVMGTREKRLNWWRTSMGVKILAISVFPGETHLT